MLPHLDALLAHGIRPDLAPRIVQAFRPHVEAWREREAWTASRRDVPVDRRLSLVTGKVEGSLFESMETLGEQAQLVLDFAEIFAWDFDFASDSQPGDRFRMLVEKVFTGDQFVKYGRILVAEYESEGKTHTGIYFRDKDGGGYYTPAGGSLRRAFLKSPLEFTRISSGYSKGRRHPILGGVRPHLAIDYAAPQGTPVWAVAEGTVEFAGWGGGNGYVGTTGLSTGPHLDYRVVKDGRFVNPLKQTFLPGKPISPSARPAFFEARDSLFGQLRSALSARSGTPPKS